MKNHQAIAWSLLMFGLSGTGMAAMLTNQIQGLGPADARQNPMVCVQNADGMVLPGCALAPGATLKDAQVCSGNAGYVGATLRFGGCESNNDYLGYIGITASGVTYQPPLGLPIVYAHPAISAQGVLTGQIAYAPIATNDQLLTQPPKKNSHWEFVGINLSGLEFGKVPAPAVIPNLSQQDASQPTSDLADTRAFLEAGMNTVRVPLHWGYLQPGGAGQGPLDVEYFNAYLKPLLETLTTAKVNAIVDLHAYMRYSRFGKEYAGCSGQGPCPDGTLITDPAVYQQVWSQLYALIKQDKHIDQAYLLFDLVNEPVGVPNDAVFTIQASVIKRLRQDGFTGYVLVEGNSWTGLHSWFAPWRNDKGELVSNASLFTRSHFVETGITDLSKVLINVHQYLDSDYSGTHDSCLTDLTTTGEQGFNLDAFVTYLKDNQLKAIVTEFGVGREASSCGPALTKFLDYLSANAAQDKNYGFVGWTLWSTGHGWGDYPLRVTPTSYVMQISKPYL